MGIAGFITFANDYELLPDMFTEEMLEAVFEEVRLVDTSDFIQINEFEAVARRCVDAVRSACDSDSIPVGVERLIGLIPRTAEEEAAEELFDKIDIDGDGVIDEAEWEEAQRAEQRRRDREQREAAERDAARRLNEQRKGEARQRYEAAAGR